MGGSCWKNLDSVLPAVGSVSAGRKQRRVIHTVDSECENGTIGTVLVAKNHMEFSLGAIALNCVIGWSMNVPSFEGGCLVDTVVLILEGNCGLLGGIGVQSESWAIAPVRPCSNGSGRKVECGRVSK